MSEPPRFSNPNLPRIVMASAIGLLLIVLSAHLGFIPHVWNAIDRAIHGPSRSLVIESEIHQSPPPAPLPPSDVPIQDSSELFLVVETAPKLLGGLHQLHERIEYPEIARKAGIEGRVFLQFVVEKDGSVSNVVVLRGIGAGCDAAAVRALQSVRFEPGLQRGNPVRVKMTLPVSFQLN